MPSDQTLSSNWRIFHIQRVRMASLRKLIFFHFPCSSIPPQVTETWTWGCQLSRLPCVWRAQKIPISSPRFPAAYSILSTARRQRSLSSQRLTSNKGHSESGRVKTRCIQSQSGRRLSWAATHRSVAFLPQDGQARLWQALVMYFTCRQPGVSQPYSFTPVMRVPQASILVTASTSISRRPPASRKEVQH